MELSDSGVIIACVFFIIFCVFLGALIAGSENALFSLSPTQLHTLAEEQSPKSKTILWLISKHKTLIATILIAGNFINVTVIMLSTYLINLVFDFSQYPIGRIFFEAIIVTFVIVLFGEILPKLYASQNAYKVSKIMALPMLRLSQFLKPLVWLLSRTSAIIDKRITKKGHTVSVDELNYAIDITSDKDTPKEEKLILKNIVNFGETDVKQVMKPRIDVAYLENNMKFTEVIQRIKQWGFSRFPVTNKGFDNVEGILFIKDVLPHINENDEFPWQNLCKPAKFVPENKKIDDLLKDFQEEKIHMAVVVDEYGGGLGIVTMDDIIEEVFGEMNDEFDVEELPYSKLDEHSFVFEGKTTIIDMCRVLQLNDDYFDVFKGESETINGLITEVFEKIPNVGQKLDIAQIEFKIETVDKRKITRVKITLPNTLHRSKS
ncbi:MAG: gliding motility-associated protein GldE [Bacteroidetes bacterium]|nr:gliding motility-associated protein GldE [Bacteroidota bacterium]